jgi:23S rRNA pseudouridine1911/1915/1917 synthase
VATAWYARGGGGVVRNGGHTYRERIGADGGGRAVLEHLGERFGRAGPEAWRERIASGQVKLDGAPTSAGTLLRAGQWLTWERPPWTEPPVPLDAAVLHEDALLLAVAKPRGLPTMPAGGLYLEHTLLAVVRRRAPGASPMHRLGRDTSGVVLFARTAAAAGAVQSAFRARRVTKVYRALCAGHPALDAFQVDAPIGEVEHPLIGTVHAAAAGGRQARSHVRVLERRGDGAAPPSALVEVEIETGRPHQIRIHLAHAGHPLVGDPLFGPGGVPRPGTRALPGDPGYPLHAWRLELEHPGDGRRLVIECAPPPALRVAVEAGPGEVGVATRTSRPPATARE